MGRTTGKPAKQAARPGPPANWHAWRWVAAAGLVLAVAMALWLWGRPGRGGEPAAAGAPQPGEALNVLLVTLDTTRADRLGSYGHAGARTRHMDRLAAEGVRFEHAFSPAPITLPAHASLFTGLYPFAHGVRNNGNFYLPERFQTLATVLHDRGYHTGAFVSAFVLDRRYGLARGFDTYDDRQEGPGTQVVRLEAERRGDRTALALLAWLDEHARRDAGRPFFAWLHLFDPHEPYRPPPPFREAFEHSPYDGEIAFDDAILASVLERLDQRALRDRTLVVVAGDHGESLGEHGEETHSMFVYESALRVPLLFWRPGLLPAGAVVTPPVRLTDVAPTILELVGASPLDTAHGRSLVPLMRGESASAAPAVYAETLLPQLYMNWAPLRAIRDDRWKYIEAPRPELYDLQADPRETRNLLPERQPVANALARELDRLTGGGRGAVADGMMDAETLEKLASLGYVGAGAEPARGTPNTQADPKDVIEVFNQLRRANSAVRDRRFADALPILERVLRDDSRNAFARLVLGSARMGMEDYPKAIVQFRRYLQLVPSSAYAHHWLSICHVRLGDQANALREADAALAIDPRFSDARVMKGGILASRGQHDAALKELRLAVKTDPAKTILRLDLARVLAEAGRLDEADREYATALSQQPGLGPALSGLGALRVRQGRLGEAEATLRQALESHPGDHDARFNLAMAYERQGKKAEAFEEYGRLVTGKTTSPAVREAARGRLRSVGAEK